MNCENFIYSGLSDCDMLFKDVVGMMIMDTKTAFATPSALATHTGIFALGSAQTGMYVPIGRGYQNNTAEPEKNTSVTGWSEKTSDPLPMLRGFLDKSYCDYKTLYGIDNQTKDVVLYLKNGKVWHTTNSAGANIGFRARISIRKNAPGADNSVENFPIDVDFLYIEDMDNAKLTPLNFSVKELVDAIPVGLTINQVVAYAGGAGAGTITVDIFKRGGITPFTGITDETSFEVLKTEAGSTDLDIDVITANKASAAIGRYVLTIKKDASSTTPANLTAGVWIRAIEVNDSEPALATYLSDPFFVRV